MFGYLVLFHSLSPVIVRRMASMTTSSGDMPSANVACFFQFDFILPEPVRQKYLLLSKIAWTRSRLAPSPMNNGRSAVKASSC